MQTYRYLNRHHTGVCVECLRISDEGFELRWAAHVDYFQRSWDLCRHLGQRPLGIMFADGRCDFGAQLGFVDEVQACLQRMDGCLARGEDACRRGKVEITGQPHPITHCLRRNAEKARASFAARRRHKLICLRHQASLLRQRRQQRQQRQHQQDFGMRIRKARRRLNKQF